MKIKRTHHCSKMVGILAQTLKDFEESLLMVKSAFCNETLTYVNNC